MATDAAGDRGLRTPWVTVTVSPDAQHAATDTVGPGLGQPADRRLPAVQHRRRGVRSLAGPHRLLPGPARRSGAAAELLTAAQQTDRPTAPASCGRSAHVTASPTAGTAGNDSLRHRPDGASRTPSPIARPHVQRRHRAAAGSDVPGHRLGLRARGHRAAAPIASRACASSASTATPRRLPGRPSSNAADQDRYLAAADAGLHRARRRRPAPFIRLYNGFTAAGKEVFFDDLSVREIWAPLGPQWSLGTADESPAPPTAHISQPYPDVAALHLAGGGEIWFTAAGTATLVARSPAPKSLTLTGRPGRPLADDRARRHGQRLRPADAATDSKLVVHLAAGGGRADPAGLRADRQRAVRLTRMIAAVEPGVDGWPTNTAACTTAVPAVGCEVHASSSTPTGAPTATVDGSFGSFADRLSEVRLWSTPAVGADGDRLPWSP